MTGRIFAISRPQPSSSFAGRRISRGFTRRIFTREMPDPEPLFLFTAGGRIRATWLSAPIGAAGGASTRPWARAPRRAVVMTSPRSWESSWTAEPWFTSPGRCYGTGTVRQGMRRQAFGYGVGLVYFTSALWARPTPSGHARRFAPAARHLLDPSSAKNADRGQVSLASSSGASVPGSSPADLPTL